MMRKLCKALCAILAAVLTVGAFSVAGSEKIETESYIWIFEAEGSAYTVMKNGRASGIGAEYTLKMRYVSLSGDKLTNGEIPTRFVGSSTFDAKYDYSENPTVASLIKSTKMPCDGADGFYSYSYSVSRNDFPGFEESEDESGTYASEMYFYPSETVFVDSMNVITALGGNNHSGMNPGRDADHKYGREIANLYFNAEADDMEIGAGTPYGVRNVQIFVTVYGSNSEKDIFSFEANGLLKRLPATPENLYGVLVSDGAKEFPDIDAQTDSLDVLESDTSILRLKAYLAGGEYWPESLPSEIPEFDEASAYKSVETENGKTVITAFCSKRNLRAYRSRLRANGFIQSGDDLYSPFAYIKTSLKAVGGRLEGRIEVLLASKFERPYEYDIFPKFRYGCMLSDPHGENTPKTDNSAWLSEKYYGASEKDVEAYGEELIAIGFDLDNDSYVYENGGYRYSFSAVPFEENGYSGMTVTYYISKVGGGN